MTTLKSKNKFLKVAASTALVASSFSTIAAPISAASFSDIEKSSHKDSIEQLLQRGIVKGFEDGTFKPNKAITRGQAAKIIASILELDTKNVTNPNFSDVDPESHYYPYIAALAKADIISGYDDDTFKPNKTITRGQMAKMLAIGFNLKTDANHPFTDVSANSQYNAYISALYAHEVTIGSTETTFSPAKHVTRGQLASFVIRAEKIKNKPTTGAISGTITAVTENTVTIDGKTLTASNKIEKVIKNNPQAFEGAKVSLTVKDNEITAIEKLEIVSNVTAFDGKDLDIAALSLPASVQTVANITADTIYYEAAKNALTANNVLAKEFYVNNEKFVIASTSQVNAPATNANVTFNGSTIDNLYSNVQQVTIAKTNSIIKNLFVANSTNITLNGDFKDVTVSANAIIEGTAKIDNLHFDGQPANYKIASSIVNGKVTIGNNVYAWNDFVAQFPTGENTGGTGSTPGGSTGGNNAGSNTGGGSNSGDNGNTGTEPGGNTGDGSNSEDNGNSGTQPGGNTGDGSNPGDNGDTGNQPGGNTGDGSNSGDNGNSGTQPGGNTGDGSNSGDNGDTSTQPGGNTGDGSNPGDNGDTGTQPGGNTGDGSNSGDNGDTGTQPGGNTGDGSNSGDNGDTGTQPGGNTGDGSDNGDTGTQPGGNTGETPTPEKEVIIIEETTNTVVVAGESFAVTDEQKQFLATQQDNIKAITLVTDENNETVIKSLTLENDIIDGAQLNQVAIETLTVVAQNVSNIANVNHLIVSNEQETTLENIDADTITAVGNITALNNVNSDTISINTTATTLSAIDSTGDINIQGPVEYIDGGDMANSITVQSTAPSVLINAVAAIDLANTNSNVKVIGQPKSIQGGTGGTLTINATSNQLQVGDVGANEIILEETPSVFASIQMMRSIASTSTMTVKFNGDYSGKTLTVKRTDTIVDVQSDKPFTTISVQGNNTTLQGGTRLAEVRASGNITQLFLYANVESFSLNMTKPLKIVGMNSEATIIENLVVTSLPAENTDGWIDLVNTVANNVSSTNVNIIKSPSVVNGQFDVSEKELSLSKYGHFSLVVPSTVTGPLYIKQLTKNDNLQTHIANITTLPGDAKKYENDAFFLDSATTTVVVYEDTGSGINVGYFDTTHIDKYKISTNHSNYKITLVNRFDKVLPIKDELGYLFIFDDGELVYENVELDDLTYNPANTNRQEIIVDLKDELNKPLDNKKEIYVTRDKINYYSSYEDAQSHFIVVLKELAKLAVKHNDPQMILNLLSVISEKNKTTFDSLFLSEYAKELATNPDKYNSANDIKKLIDELTPEYQLNIQLSPADVYLNSLPILGSTTYSKENIVEIAVAEAEGKIMLNPKNEGTTTVRLIDKDGLATLMNVTVSKDLNNQPFIANDGYKVIAVEEVESTLLDGSNNFRFFTKDAKTYLLPTKFENGFALLKSDNTFTGYAQTVANSVYNLEKRTINKKDLSLAELGLTTLTEPTSTNIGFLPKDDKSGYILYPRAEVVANEKIKISDGTNETVINVKANLNEVTDIAIADSNEVSIKNALRLDAITNTVVYPQGTKDIHYTIDGDNLQFFANNPANVAYVFADSANRKTLVNVNADETTGVLDVNDVQIVNANISSYSKNGITDDNSNATVTDISGTSVRAHDLDIFATQTGTSIVTLSNGNQYEFTVKQTSNQFTIEADKVTNLIVKATDLHMTNIKEASSSNASDRLQVVDGKLVVNLAADGTSKITVKSDTEPVETTVLYVTKNGNNYTFDPTTDIVRAELEASELGLTSVTNEFGESTPTARIKIAGGKVYIYGFTEGTRSFRVSDGTNSTAINATVNTVEGKLTVSAEAVKYDVAVQENATITSTAARVDRTTLYATGLGLDTNGQAIVEVPVAYAGTDEDNVKAFDSIVLSKHPDTNLLSFGTATKTFKKSINKADFDFTTLHSPTVSAIPNSTLTADGISATIVDDQLVITSTKKGEGRVQINESSTATKNAFVYVNNDGTNFIATVEKSAAIDLGTYGFTATPVNIAQPFTVEGIVRPQIDESLKLDLYALAAGNTAYTIQGSDGKNLFMNVAVADAKPRTVSADVVKVGNDVLNGIPTIIEGDAVRLSPDKSELYANKLGTTSIVKHANGDMYKYEVVLEDGKYKINPTPIAKSGSIELSKLGLDGTLQVTNLDSSIASYSITDSEIVVYSNATSGTTSMTVSNGSKSVVVNVTIEADKITVSEPILTPIATSPAPIFIDTNDTSIIRIENGKAYALSAGSAELLVGDEVQQITVTKNANNQYEITGPVTISKAVYEATDFGFDTSAAMTIKTEEGNTDFTVTKVDNKIVAYSNLTGSSTGSSNVYISASADEKTLLYLKDPGNALMTANIAKQNNAIHASAVINNPAIARQKDGVVYALSAGTTFATIKHDTLENFNYIQSIEVKPNAAGLLEATFADVKLEGTYSALTETDNALVGFIDGHVYAKATSGTTVVQKSVTEDGKTVNKVFQVTITNTNGKIDISEKAISSKTLLPADAHLVDITTAKVASPAGSDAVTLSVLNKNGDKDGLTIYSNTSVAQNLTILVTDKNGDQAFIDVAIDETGAITKADYVKYKIIDLAINLTTAETVKTDKARGIWSGNVLTVYPTDTSNTALKFTNGLVNVTTTLASNKVTTTATILEQTSFDAANNISNGHILNANVNYRYPTDVGTAIVHNGSSVYVVNVALENNHYKMTVSDALPFKSITLGTDDSYSLIGPTLNGVSVAIDENVDDNETTTNDRALIIYKSGDTVGSSDILITSGAGLNSLKTVYHVKTTSTTVEEPKEAKVNTEAPDAGAWANFKGATLVEGSSVRLDTANNIYYLEQAASTLKHNNRLVTVDVTRDMDGYFTATPAYVKETLTAEAIPNTSTDPAAPSNPLTNYEIDASDRKVVYAKSTTGAAESLLIPDTSDASSVKAYYATFSTVANGNKYEVQIDERKAYQYDPELYGLTGTIVTDNNTESTVASAKVIDGKIAIVAGDKPASTVITLKDSTGKTLVFNATLDTDGQFNVYPQAALNSLDFASIGLTTETGAITVSPNVSEIIDVKATASGLNITAKTEGTTSLELIQGGKTVGLVNVTVKEVNDNLQITAKPLSYTTDLEALYTTGSARTHTVDGTTTYYPTAIGLTLYGANNTGQLINITKNSATDQYSISNTTHALSTITKDELSLDKITTASSSNAAVGTIVSSGEDEVYIYGQNTDIADVTISNGTEYAKVIANNGTSLTTTIAKISIDDPYLQNLTWESAATLVAKVRNNEIYTQDIGKTLLTAEKDGHNIYMNVEVVRNQNRTFKITPEIVSLNETTWANIEPLKSDQDVVSIVGTTIYANEIGSTYVKIKENNSNDIKLYNVTISEASNGTMKIELGEAIPYLEIPVVDLGLTTLDSPKVKSYNGADVVSAEISDDKQTLIIKAKNSGEAEVTVNNGATSIHVLVVNESNSLTIDETIAKKQFEGKSISIFYSEPGANIIRIEGDEIFALKAGKVVANIGDELHNVTVEKNDYQFSITSDRIEYTFENATEITIPENSNVVKRDGQKIVAVSKGSVNIVVDGKKYQVTVSEEGTIDVILFTENIFDFADSKLSASFSSIETSGLKSKQGLVTATAEGSKVTISVRTTNPSAGTDIVTVSNGPNTVQLKATVEAVDGGFAVTKVELVSQTLTASDLNNIYAAKVLDVANPTETFDSTIGIIVNENGLLTVYPGDDGDTDFIVEDSEGKRGYFTLTANALNTAESFTVAPVMLTIPFDEFNYVPTVLAKHGKANATNVGQNLQVTFGDDQQSLFVTSSDGNLYHTVLVKPKVEGNKLVVSDYDVQAGAVVNGSISNLSASLLSISHNNNTVIYATSVPQTAAYFTSPEGIIQQVKVNSDNYGVNFEPLAYGNDNRYTFTELLVGDDVIKTDSAEGFLIKQSGTGIYKTDDGKYVEITVGDENSDFVISSITELTSINLADQIANLNSVEVLAPAENVYADGKVIYGKTTSEKIALSVTTTGQNSKSIYVANGSFNNNTAFEQLKINILAELGWSDFALHNLNSNSQFGVIQKTTTDQNITASFIPSMVNTEGEQIVFTSPNGIQKTLMIKVNADYTISVDAGKNELNYSFTQGGSSIVLSFSSNVDSSLSQFIVLDSASTASVEDFGLWINNDIDLEITETINLNLPELTSQNGPITIDFTRPSIHANWLNPTFTSNDFKFNFVVQ